MPRLLAAVGALLASDEWFGDWCPGIARSNLLRSDCEQLSPFLLPLASPHHSSRLNRERWRWRREGGEPRGKLLQHDENREALRPANYLSLSRSSVAFFINHIKVDFEHNQRNNWMFSFLVIVSSSRAPRVAFNSWASTRRFVMPGEARSSRIILAAWLNFITKPFAKAQQEIKLIQLLLLPQDGEGRSEKMSNAKRKRLRLAMYTQSAVLCTHNNVDGIKTQRIS